MSSSSPLRVRMRLPLVVIMLSVLCIAGLGLTAWAVRRAPAEPALAALIEQWRVPAAAPGTNAFSHVWLIKWDIPDADRAAVLSEDRSRALQRARELAQAAGTAELAPRFVSSAESRFTGWPLEALPQLRCGDGGDACLSGLASVEPEAWKLLDRAPQLQDRLEAVHGFDHLRADDDFHFATYMTAAHERSEAARVWLALAARTFRKEDPSQGLAMACRAVETSTRFAEHSSHLISRLIESRQIRASLHLTAELLAEYPLHAPLPSECERLRHAMEPQLGSLCAVMGAEFRWFEASIRLAMQGETADAWPSDAGDSSSLLFDPGLTSQWKASSMSWACDEDVLQQIHRLDPEVIQRVQDWPWEPPALQCAANPVGCTLSRISRPDLSTYVAWLMNELSALRMARVLLELRPLLMEGRSMSEAMKHLKAQGVPEAGRIRLEDAQIEWEMPSREGSALSRWPLPGSRVQPH